jgi:hypothetical protein
VSQRVLLLQLDGHERYDEERPGLPNLAWLEIDELRARLAVDRLAADGLSP